MFPVNWSTRTPLHGPATTELGPGLRVTKVATHELALGQGPLTQTVKNYVSQTWPPPAGVGLGCPRGSPDPTYFNNLILGSHHS
jgi:hypothetical protein